jgi:P27 family predicted phage terminase small subunit
MLRGNPSKLPSGALLDETLRPDVEVPYCPRHLDDEARNEWHRITPHLKKLGLISQIDRAALAGYCEAWGEYVWASRRIQERNDQAKAEGDATGERARIWDTPSGYKQMSVLVQIRNRSMEQLRQFLSEFGMSPAARARVTRSDPQLDLPGVDDKPSEGGWATFR